MAMITAVETARLVCCVMLFECCMSDAIRTIGRVEEAKILTYARTPGTHPEAPIVVRKTPKYRTPGCGAYPVAMIPAMVMTFWIAR